MLKVKNEIGQNGKPFVRLSKDCSGTVRKSRDNKFNFNRDNLFIIEYKVNSPNLNPDRKFVISIRKDGSGINQGETMMSQMSLNKDELLILRENIDYILNN